MYTVSLLDHNSTIKEELSIYDPFTSDEEFMLTEPKLSIFASQAGTFSCVIPITNRGYDKIVNHRTRAVVRKDGKIIFMGRITSCYKDLYLNQKIEAEGALAYLNDSLTGKEILQNKTLAELLTYIFTNHNSKFPNEKWKQFNLAVCEGYFIGRDTTDPNSNLLSLYSVNYYPSMECVTELLTLANAVLKIAYNDTTEVWDVYVYPKYKCPKCSQSIEFGVNLVDLIQSYENDICSAVAPFGGDLIQDSKEIGEIVAGITNQYILLTSQPDNWADHFRDYYIKVINQYTGDEEYKNLEGDSAPPFIQDTYYMYEWDPNHIYGNILLRGQNDYDYVVYETADSGSFAFTFDIESYNASHPLHPIKKLYVSWRAYRHEPSGYICDNAWRVVTRIPDETAQRGYIDQSLGYHELTSSEFTGEINEEIDLTKPEYYRATHILVGGWGGLIKPTIRRDAIIVEEADKVNITKCDEINPDENDDKIGHDAGSPYLYSKTYLDEYGLIEKKLEYNIDDSLNPIYPFSHPFSSNLGSSRVFDGYALGYNVPYDENNDTYDFEANKGLYNIIHFNPVYKCIEYILPDVGNPYRPRGVFITSRMHQYEGFHGDDGLYYDPETNAYWCINGMYTFLDTSHQVLAYKAASKKEKGVGFTNLDKEYIDLTSGQFYGAKYIRVGGYIGDFYNLDVVPSDDSYARNLLLTQARSYLTQQQWEKIVIEAAAIDLNMVDSDWKNFDICENAEVYSNPHSITATLPISSIELQLDNYENNTIKLGYDSDEYLSNQLADNLRIMSIEQALEEKRKEKS